MDANDFDSPTVGEDAYRRRTLAATSDRAAQLQCMTIRAAGSRRQIKAVDADAEAIGTPAITKADDLDRHIELLHTDQLDFYTASSLRTKGARSGWEPGRPATLNDLRTARRRVLETRSWLELAFLLNVSMAAPSELERTVAAQALHFLSRGSNYRAQDVLWDASTSQSVVVAEIASLAATERTPPPAPLPTDVPPSGEPYPDHGAARGPKSLAIHGTWARLAPERWYAPGSDLHNHLVAEASPTTMYVGKDYFRWSGSYTRKARERAAKQLIAWIENRYVLIDGIDTVYAHSHGGNVALSAAALGMDIELLVLMHVPPRSRPRKEWAAIRKHVRRAVVYRAALDPVVLADMIRDIPNSGDVGRTLTQHFEQSWIPHEDTEPHPTRGPRATHDFYVKLQNWQERSIAADVVHWHDQPPMT